MVSVYENGVSSFDTTKKNLSEINFHDKSKVIHTVPQCWCRMVTNVFCFFNEISLNEADLSIKQKMFNRKIENME